MSFFAQGLHSLAVIRLARALSDRLATTVPLDALFAYDTVARLAAHLAGEVHEGGSPDASELAVVDGEAVGAPAGEAGAARDAFLAKLPTRWVPSQDLRCRGLTDAQTADDGPRVVGATVLLPWAELLELDVSQNELIALPGVDAALQLRVLRANRNRFHLWHFAYSAFRVLSFSSLRPEHHSTI